ncbi:unnamed protein product [Rhizophagus irregularis]|nr:unnamed protein product [Rhizophagus irregularis]CAB4443868.1 unnamed protein product [Rhizophagus irregularis]
MVQHFGEFFKVFKKELDIWKVYENKKIFFTWAFCLQFGRMEMVSSLEHTRCLKYKRVDFRFQILVPVLM